MKRYMIQETDLTKRLQFIEKLESKFNPRVHVLPLPPQQTYATTRSQVEEFERCLGSGYNAITKKIDLTYLH